MPKRGTRKLLAFLRAWGVRDTEAGALRYPLSGIVVPGANVDEYDPLPVYGYGNSLPAPGVGNRWFLVLRPTGRVPVWVQYASSNQPFRWGNVFPDQGTPVPLPFGYNPQGFQPEHTWHSGNSAAVVSGLFPYSGGSSVTVPTLDARLAVAMPGGFLQFWTANSNQPWEFGVVVREANFGDA